MKAIVKVVSQTPAAVFTKQDGTTFEKSTIVLQELGGQYEDAYVATAMGPLARTQFQVTLWVWLINVLPGSVVGITAGPFIFL